MSHRKRRTTGSPEPVKPQPERCQCGAYTVDRPYGHTTVQCLTDDTFVEMGILRHQLDFLQAAADALREVRLMRGGVDAWPATEATDEVIAEARRALGLLERKALSLSA